MSAWPLDALGLYPRLSPAAALLVMLGIALTMPGSPAAGFRP